MDKTYSELLRDPRWQKRKTEIMQRDNFTCQKCGCKTKTLNVHHLHYLPNRKPWEYPDDDLVTLCEDCHSKIHEKTTPKIGGVYSTEHSDFKDYVICYGINFSKNVIYLLGMDTGAGEYTIFFESVSLDFFKKYYKNEPGVLEYIYDEDKGYIGNVLASMLANIYEYGSNGRNDYSYECLGFDYSDERVIEYAKQNVMRVVNTNDNLLAVFRDIIC